jgi:uncharacterized glyoxalase superfamily protein PhnB
MVKQTSGSAMIIPTLRYADAAVEWLCRALGFTRHLVVPGPNETIAHAQVTYRNSMIMLGSIGEGGGEYDRLIQQPSEVGGASTQAPYVIVDDVDAHCAQARAAGAEIVMEHQIRIMAVVITPVATARDTSGTSGRMTRGQRQFRSIESPEQRQGLGHFRN